MLSPPSDIGDVLNELEVELVGQDSALAKIAPVIDMYRAGLSPSGRPAGVFLLLGPTGTGKTHTVEALAKVLHGSDRALVRIDCAEFQSDHEIAKLIGAPPGYIGHRETKPVLSPQRLDDARSTRSRLALVLFDEVEKAAPALTTLLLGVLDKATLRLGDGTDVGFEDTFIFMTSNLGVSEMTRELGHRLGFQGTTGVVGSGTATRLERIGLAAVHRRFSPEFVNRLDAVITYRPLDTPALERILDQQIDELQRHVHGRLGEKRFDIVVRDGARRRLLDWGTSAAYGARELRRALHRHVTQPLAAMVARQGVSPGSTVIVDVHPDADQLRLSVGAASGAAPSRPRVLVVDDNPGLLAWTVATLQQAGYDVVRAGDAAEALAVSARQRPSAVVVDFLLPDTDGLTLSLELRARLGDIGIVAASGLPLDTHELDAFTAIGIPVVTKPFVAERLLRLVASQVRHHNVMVAG